MVDAQPVLRIHRDEGQPEVHDLLARQHGRLWRSVSQVVEQVLHVDAVVD